MRFPEHRLRAMKSSTLLIPTLAALGLGLAQAQNADPFAGLNLEEYKEPAAPDLDRKRGVVDVRTEDANYTKLDHAGPLGMAKLHWRSLGDVSC